MNNNNTSNDAPPPAYSFARPIRVISRVGERPLRATVGTFAFVYCLWTAVWSGQHFKYMTKAGETAGMRIFDLIQGIIYAVIAVTMGLGVFAALKKEARILRLYSFATVGVVALSLLAGIIEIISTYTQKQGLIDQCANISVGTVVNYGWFSQTGTLSAEDAQTYCQRAWSRQAWQDFVWLLAEVCFASAAAVFAFAFARQLANPAFGSGVAQHHQQAPNYGVPLQPYQSAAPDYVPAYPGPPPQGAPSDHDAKSSAPFSSVPISAQDEAWNNSLAESERREWEQHRANEAAGSNGSRSHGAFKNDEEDEAWENARANGGTAGYMNGGGNSYGGARKDDDGGRIV